MPATRRRNHDAGGRATYAPRPLTKLLLALGLGAVLALAFLGIKNRHRFRYRPAPLGEPEYLRLAAQPGWRADTIELGDGVTLRGLLRPPRSSPDWLLFFPGNGGGMLHSAQSLLDKLAAEVDVGVAVYAYRGFDGSGGTPSAAALFADAAAIHAHVCRQHGAAPARLHLGGFSLGTGIALRLAGTLTAKGAPPASLVLLAPYTSLQVTADAWWAPWSFADEYDALGAASASTCKALLMHGTADNAVPITAGRALAQAMGARAEFVAVDGAGHAEWLGQATTVARVGKFLREAAARR